MLKCTDADITVIDAEVIVVDPFAGFAGIAAINKGFQAGIKAYDWTVRGKYYSDYFKNTGKKPRYYNKLTRRRIKW